MADRWANRYRGPCTPTGSVLLPEALQGRTRWATPAKGKVGRGGERLVRVWRGLGRLWDSFCHRQKLKRELSQCLCVSVNTLGLQPPPG